MEPLEGAPAGAALVGHHLPPGGGWLAEVVTNHGVRGPTRGGQEILGPHRHMPRVTWIIEILSSYIYNLKS